MATAKSLPLRLSPSRWPFPLAPLTAMLETTHSWFLGCGCRAARGSGLVLCCCPSTATGGSGSTRWKDPRLCFFLAGSVQLWLYGVSLHCQFLPSRQPPHFLLSFPFYPGPANPIGCSWALRIAHIWSPLPGRRFVLQPLLLGCVPHTCEHWSITTGFIIFKGIYSTRVSKIV